MSFIPWPNGVQLCFDFLSSGQSWQVCIALRKSAGAPTTTDLQDIADAAANWWNTSMKNNIENSSTLTQTRATDMTAEGGPVRYHLSGVAGAIAGTDLPLSAALVTSMRTEKRGRSYRGRVYMSGHPQSILTNQVDVGAGPAANLTTSWLALQTTLDALGFDTVVVSRQHNGVVTNPAELNEVVQMITDLHLDSQRRRLAGRGT